MGAMKNKAGKNTHKMKKPSTTPSQAASAMVINGNAMNSIKINAIMAESEALNRLVAVVAKADSKK
ncbi:hypothetical protein QP315_06720 [Actinotignum timonense]|uniref:hypothetical protein n=1 Tax=Actinomycetes TaxID=1760 RepID=UPI00254A4886|nr:hypothetical protein [Actinotignum timonense]MDK6906910.1 hypothetical protein [Actinotignum timonense]